MKRNATNILIYATFLCIAHLTGCKKTELQTSQTTENKNTTDYSKGWPIPAERVNGYFVHVVFKNHFINSVPQTGSTSFATFADPALPIQHSFDLVSRESLLPALKGNIDAGTVAASGDSLEKSSERNFELFYVGHGTIDTTTHQGVVWKVQGNATFSGAEFFIPGSQPRVVANFTELRHDTSAVLQFSADSIIENADTITVVLLRHSYRDPWIALKKTVSATAPFIAFEKSIFNQHVSDETSLELLVQGKKYYWKMHDGKVFLFTYVATLHIPLYALP